ncbi:ABC transporter substrate-binding protein [Chitinivibrio alkaliphilus]|uniref:ABC transporter substrate-binding protein n=1 Tax=Chitinivibrio alkaliphilus ACht1 TaxID=1313304 RepID=U7DAK5_9BACT|nr:ABC transporter substrate-binding protein [Chitinivibrio alkaliphilus]ERP32162.1 ABC transporter substrate-binding protein [Chitinivibrio alkaliphilus ACht1]
MKKGPASLFLMGVVSLLILVGACSSPDELAHPGEYPRSQTLYMGGHVWDAPRNFNPLNSWPVTWPATANSNLLFETLFAFNINSGQLEPLLGREWSLSEDLLVVSLHDRARWNDGRSVTNDDVLYTFHLHRQYPTLFSDVWDHINDMFVLEETGQIVFELCTEDYNPLVVKDALATVPILPGHVYAPLENAARTTVEQQGGRGEDQFAKDVLSKLQSFENLDRPVGSGPYTVIEATESRVGLVRIPTYWGNDVLYEGRQAGPKYIVHPIYESNREYNDALRCGDIDVSSTFSQNIEEMRSDGVGTWFDEEPYYVPGSIPSLVVQHLPEDVLQYRGESLPAGWTKNVLQDRVFRRVVDMAIDREAIRSEAMHSYAPPIHPGYIISHDMPTGNIEGTYFSVDDAHAAASYYYEEDHGRSLAAARRKLREAGYEWSSEENLISPVGDTVYQLRVTCPAGWTDWEDAVEIAVANMQEVGIPAEAVFINEGEYWEALARGDFDFIVKTPQANQVPSLPWSRFESALASSSVVPVGEWASGNEGRYVHSGMDSLLKRIPAISSDEELAEAYEKLNRIFMEEVPLIPLMYRPSVFYQFTTTYWSGFPTHNDGKGISPQNLNVGSAVKGLWELYPTER